MKKRVFSKSKFAISISLALLNGLPVYAATTVTGPNKTTFEDQLFNSSATTGASALKVEQGGEATLNGTSTIMVTVNAAKGIDITDTNSFADINGTADIDLGTYTGAVGINVENNGVLNVNDGGSLNIHSSASGSGTGPKGVVVTSGGTANLGNGTSIITSGSNSQLTQAEGIYVNNGASQDNDTRVTANNINIQTHGVNSAAIVVENDVSTSLGSWENTKSGIVQLSGTQNQITTTGAGSAGLATRATTYGSSLILVGNSSAPASVTITTSGENAAGISATTNGRIVLSGDNNIITTTGNNAYGVTAAAVSGMLGGQDVLGLVQIEGNANQIITQGDAAHAVYAGAGGNIVIDNTAGSSLIEAQGAGAHAVYANGASSTVLVPASITLNQNGGSISSAQGDVLRADSAILTATLQNTTLSSKQGRIIAATQSGASSVAGTVSVLAGTGAQLNGQVYADAASHATLTLDSGASWTGWGNGADVTVQQGGLWTMNDNSVLKSLSNAGNIVIGHNGTDFRTITVEGNYVGNGGTLTMNTVFGDDNSQTDKLIITGDSSGSSYLKINNAGGTGALTVNGIEVVEVGGDSSGKFALSGRATAGGYEYYLYQGTPKQNDGNWYLRSELPTPDDGPVPDPDPTPNPTPDPDPGTDPAPTPDPGSDPTPPAVVAPEVGAYIGNQLAANMMFMHTLHQRLGEPQFTNALREDTARPTAMWLRVTGDHTKARAAGSQLRLQTNTAVVQLGGDIAQWTGEDNDRLHLGIMGGAGRAWTNSHSRLSDYNAKGNVDGYNVGVYGTWYNNALEQTGLYVDSWLQYSWFSNEVKGDYLERETYDSDGFTASLESGYTFSMYKGENKEWFIQPKAQVVWSGIKADDFNDAQGQRVSQSDDDNIMTRLGLRTYLRGSSPVNRAQIFQPFMEVNWIHNTSDFGVQYATPAQNGDFRLQGTKDIGEAKVGLQGQLSRNLSVWGEVSHQVGNQGYYSTSGLLGVKYVF